VEQAFQSTSGFWPRSPIAFPGRLPFMTFVGDALVSASFRYLPIPLNAFHYSQTLFCWAIVLWTAVALIAGAGPWRAAIALSMAVFAAPMFFFGVDHFGETFAVSFSANPNSLVAWPIGIALALHLYRSFQRHAPPDPLVLVLVPPASLFFKANQ